MTDLRAPFPWNGGKSREADTVWRAFGPDVANYVEPFCATCATLLGRPGGAGKIETVNDIDGGIVNFWRAVKSVPDEVAGWCDWPVSELDLHARHAWLVGRLEEMAEQLRADMDYFDAKVAGLWVWGICQWIGTGWCGGVKRGRPRPNLNSGQGVHAKGTRDLPHTRPRVSGDSAGMGILSRQLPSLRVDSGASGNGTHASGLSKKMPTCTSAGMGVHLPAIGNDRGINGVAAPPCLDWFLALQERLRRVRLVCGDWRRVLGPSVLGKGKNVGGRRPCAVFLDPPYDVNLRAKRIYGNDAPGVSVDVRLWALLHGDDPDLRIALCGYLDEHGPHMPATWTVHRWKGARGYAGDDNANREQETIWFSPHCLPIEQQRGLFDEVGT